MTRARDNAERGLGLLKGAILETLAVSKSGLTNAEVSDALGIRSDYLGKQKDYLSWSLLGLLLNEGSIQRQGRRYTLSPNAGDLPVK